MLLPVAIHAQPGLLVLLAHISSWQTCLCQQYAKVLDSFGM